MFSETFLKFMGSSGMLAVVSALLTLLFALIPAIYIKISKEATRKIQAKHKMLQKEMLSSALESTSKYSFHVRPDILTQHEKLSKEMQKIAEQHAASVSEYESLQKEREAYLKAAKEDSVFQFLKIIYSEIITTFSSLVIATLALESLNDTSKAKTNTIVGMMLKEKLDSYNKNCCLITVGLITYNTLLFFSLVQFHLAVLIIPLCLLGAMYLDQYLIIYRVKKGWYGRNEYESREIISYIIAHAKPEDFNNDGGLKTLMDEPEREKLNVADNNGGVRA